MTSDRRDDRIRVDDPTSWELFVGFLVLGATGFGGVLPLAQRTMVQKRRWMSEEEFADLLALCQFLPGGNIVNMSVVYGMRVRGVTGAISGLLGLVAVPTAFVVAVAELYSGVAGNKFAMGAITGTAAAAAGLLLAFAVKLIRHNRFTLPGFALAGATAVAVGVLHISLVIALPVAAAIGIAAGAERLCRQ